MAVLFPVKAKKCFYNILIISVVSIEGFWSMATRNSSGKERNAMSILKSVPTVNGMELNSPEKCAPYLFKQMFTKPTIEEH